MGSFFLIFYFLFGAFGAVFLLVAAIFGPGLFTNWQFQQFFGLFFIQNIQNGGKMKPTLALYNRKEFCCQPKEFNSSAKERVMKIWHETIEGRVKNRKAVKSCVRSGLLQNASKFRLVLFTEVELVQALKIFGLQAWSSF